MSDVTRILSRIESGDSAAADLLLPLVYDELRKLAAQRLAQEHPGQTLQATALVHEAYLRLVGQRNDLPPGEAGWDSRGHFFAAAAEAMRRILVEAARRKHSLKRGGGRDRIKLDEELLAAPDNERLLEIDEALDRLSAESPQAAELVKLRYFVGLSLEEAAGLLGISRTKAYETWSYAKSWLWCALQPE